MENLIPIPKNRKLSNLVIQKKLNLDIGPFKRRLTFWFFIKQIVINTLKFFFIFIIYLYLINKSKIKIKFLR